ncbi:MAG: hypothetical protein ACUZ8H_01495 [Candidatus Anammoxibacter sp.]
MTLDAAQIIDQYSMNDVEIREDYSGRAMYGGVTDAIVMESVSEFYGSLGRVMMNGNEDDRRIVGEFLQNIRQDSMGLSVIFY